MIRLRMLNPERVRIQVPELSWRLSEAYPDGNRRVCPDPESYMDAHILSETLVAEAVAGSSHYAVELSFATAENHAALRGRPSLDRAGPTDSTATAGAILVLGHPAQSVSVNTST